METRPVLVTGSTGYIGGRLVPRLLAAGYRVRAAARSLDKLEGRTWAGHPNLELVQADLLDPFSTAGAVKGCFAAYYLVHSMNSRHHDFVEVDRAAARNFINQVRGSGLERIIYLGGLGEDKAELSPHLRSRAEVGRILTSGPASATILRSAVILGSGSASFEILRYLTERLPVLIIPGRVAATKIQPICIRNVLDYLVGCLEREETRGQSYDIGGPDVLTYRRLFEDYALEAGLNTPVFITPNVRPTRIGRRLAIAVAKMVLPMPPAIAEPLLEGVTNDVVVRDYRITTIMPQHLMTCREAIKRAIQKESLQIVETRWTDAGQLIPPEWVYSGDAPYAGGTLLQGGFKVTIAGSAREIWPTISRLGGPAGWYYGDILWELRGLMDSLAGGVGLRRGRRHPEHLLVGDALDFWRVLEVEPPRRLILVAEMKLPGEAILDFELVDLDRRRTELRLNTRFSPKGLYGLAYWYSLLPIHDLLFGGLLREVARRVGRPIINGPEKFKPQPISQKRSRKIPAGTGK